MGDFNSLRIDIGVEDDCRDGEKVDDAFNRVYTYVEDKLIKKVNEAKEELRENGD